MSENQNNTSKLPETQYKQKNLEYHSMETPQPNGEFNFQGDNENKNVFQSLQNQDIKNNNVQEEEEEPTKRPDIKFTESLFVPENMKSTFNKHEVQSIYNTQPNKDAEDLNHEDIAKKLVGIEEADEEEEQKNNSKVNTKNHEYPQKTLNDTKDQYKFNQNDQNQQYNMEYTYNNQDFVQRPQNPLEQLNHSHNIDLNQQANSQFFQQNSSQVPMTKAPYNPLENINQHQQNLNQNQNFPNYTNNSIQQFQNQNQNQNYMPPNQYQQYNNNNQYNENSGLVQNPFSDIQYPQQQNQQQQYNNSNNNNYSSNYQQFEVDDGSTVQEGGNNGFYLDGQTKRYICVAAVVFIVLGLMVLM